MFISRYHNFFFWSHQKTSPRILGLQLHETNGFYCPPSYWCFYRRTFGCMTNSSGGFHQFMFGWNDEFHRFFLLLLFL